MWIWIPHRAFTQPTCIRLNAESARTSMYSSSENSVLFMQQFNQLHCEFHHSLSLKTSKMTSKYCSRCNSMLLLTSFLKNVDADPASRKYSTCITCREKSRKRCAPAITSHPPIPPTPPFRPPRL